MANVHVHDRDQFRVPDEGRNMNAVQSDRRFQGTKHIAHLHLLSVINTESHRYRPDQIVRILDAGCGDCRLIAYLAAMLPRLQPSITFEFYGFDVSDFWPIENFGRAIDDLARQFPSFPWSERIVGIPVNASWPFDDEFFDIIISNQVGEHLGNHDHFFSEIARCLGPRGYSANLFPLKHVVMEWHVLVPFAHRIKNYDLLKAVIAAFSRLGLGAVRRKAPSVTLEEFSASQAEYVVKYTRYISYGELLQIAKRYGLLVSMRYTREFYTQKLRQIFSRPPLYEYSRKRSVIGDWLLVFGLRYLQGVTVVLEKGGRFRADLHELPGGQDESSVSPSSVSKRMRPKGPE